MSVGTLAAKLSFVGTVSLSLSLSAGVDWDWWLSYGNFTARYIQPQCIDEGVDRRAEFEALIREYLAASADLRRELAPKHELWIACERLTICLHESIVDEYLAGRCHYMRDIDRYWEQQLKDVLDDKTFQAAHAPNIRNIQRMKERLSEVDTHVPLHMQRIAHTPKIVIICSALVAIGYVLYRKYGDKIAQLAVLAEEKVEEGVTQAGHQIVQAIENYEKEHEKPNEKPEKE